MVVFFKKGANHFIAVETDHRFNENESDKLSWLFGGATPSQVHHSKVDSLDRVVK